MLGTLKYGEKGGDGSSPWRSPMRVMIPLAAVASLFLGACFSGEPPEKPKPAAPLKLDEIRVRGSGAGLGFTPTAVGIGAAGPIHTPTVELPAPGAPKEGPNKTAKKPEEKAVKKPEEKGATKPEEKTAKKPEEKSAKKPEEKTAPPSKPTPPPSGTYTLQVGAYVVDANLTEAKDKVTALGLVPYVVEMKRALEMYCVIVQAQTTEKEAHDTAGVLASKGFEPQLLGGAGGLVDVAAGIYYYGDEAKEAARKAEALGYRPVIEHRTVEATLRGLRIGAYGTVEEAQGDITLLRKGGFSPVILKGGQ